MANAVMVIDFEKPLVLPRVNDFAESKEL